MDYYDELNFSYTSWLEQYEADHPCWLSSIQRYVWLTKNLTKRGL